MALTAVTAMIVVHSVTLQDNALPDVKTKKQSNSSKNVYSQLITSFREMTDVYEGNCNKHDIDSMLCYFQTSVGNVKTKIVSNKGHIPDTTGNQFVNSNVKCSKKRKSHGVKF